MLQDVEGEAREQRNAGDLGDPTDEHMVDAEVLLEVRIDQLDEAGARAIDAFGFLCLHARAPVEDGRTRRSLRVAGVARHGNQQLDALGGGAIDALVFGVIRVGEQRVG